ncbi:MAG: FG-GAP repeat protein, partial [Myxococcota bacterium]
MLRSLPLMLLAGSCATTSSLNDVAEPSVPRGDPRITSPALSELTPRRVQLSAEGCVDEAWLCRDRSCAGVTKSVQVTQGRGAVELEPGAWLVHGRCDDGRRSPAIAFQVTATGFTRPAGMDVNGDGYADLVVGAGTFGEPLPGARRGPGAVAVYFGGPS